MTPHSSSAQKVKPPLDPVLALHHVANGVMPLALAARAAFVRDDYQRLMLEYRRDFLRQRRSYPRGAIYRLLDAQQVTPHGRAYRLQAPVGLRHEGGNTLMLRWANAESEVRAVLAAGGWSASQRVKLRTASSAFNPGQLVETDLATALREHVEIRVASPEFLRRLAPGAEIVAQPALSALLTTQARQVRIDDVLALQPRIEPRSYSISNIERTPRGDIVEILVSDISDAVTGTDGASWQFAGRCGGYLATLQAGRGVVRGWPLTFPLTLATESASTRPLLVIATGIAAAGPLCEWQLLAWQRPLWLICGVRRFDAGQYLQRLLACAAAHPSMRMDIALSRDAAPLLASPVPNCHWHDYSRVHQVLQAQRDVFRRHFDAGGDTVVVGHTGMGTTIRQWLTQFLATEGHAGDGIAARNLLHKLEMTLRVQYSLSGSELSGSDLPGGERKAAHGA